METKNKTVGKYADVSIYEGLGRYKVGIESDNGSVTETYTAEYEAQERYDSLETEEDVKQVLKENGEYEEDEE